MDENNKKGGQAGQAAANAAGTVAGNPAGEPQGTGAGVEGAGAAEPTARERYMSRYKEKHPDLNVDDEEAFYGMANQNLDELEGYRESNRKLGEAMEKTPLLAGLVLAAKEGEDPFSWLVENIGPDMDIRELANDPEFAKKMGEALTKFQDRDTKNQQQLEAIGKNVAKSVETLKELQQEMGLSDDQCVKMCQDFFGEIDEEGKPVGKESFMYKASNGVVTKGMWESLVKGRNYDADVKSAGDKAAAKALNGRIQNGLRHFGESEVPSLSGSGKGAGEKKPAKKGGFASWGEEE